MPSVEFFYTFIDKNMTSKILNSTLLFVLVSMTYPAYPQLQDALKLTLSSGPYSDEIIIPFLEEATDYFDLIGMHTNLKMVA